MRNGAERVRARILPRALLATWVAVAGACSQPPSVVEERLLVWGTPATIEIHDAEPQAAHAALREVAARFVRLTREWHAWKPSALARINVALRDCRPAPAPASVLALLERVRPHVQRSGGLFDPAIGGLIEMWGFHADHYPVETPAPEPGRIQRWLAARPRLDDLEIGADGVLRAPCTPDPVQLDFGAVGEGAALEQAAAILRRHGIEHALLDLGGDLLAIGRRGGRAWQVAIEAPGGEGGWLARLELGDGEGLFTSGNYVRYRPAPDGGRWPHILDPRTGMPASGGLMAVALGRDPVAADALSTALLIGGPEALVELAAALEVDCALLVTAEGEVLVTPPLHRRLQFHDTAGRIRVVGVDAPGCR